MIVDILGWVYFSCWSISFYPQIILNYSRGSCQGLSSDFALLNLLGFLAYAIYTCSLSFSTELKNQYQKRWNSSPAIPLQDTIFAIHALALTLFTCIQMIYYSHHTDSASNKLSHACLFFIQFSCFGLLLLLVETVVGSLLMLDVVYYLSGVKMVISFIKYVYYLIS
jgi:cystinosin